MTKKKQTKEIKIRKAIQTDMVGDIPFTTVNIDLKPEDTISALQDACLEVADAYEIPYLQLIASLHAMGNQSMISEKEWIAENKGSDGFYHEHMWDGAEDYFEHDIEDVYFKLLEADSYFASFKDDEELENGELDFDPEDYNDFEDEEDFDDDLEKNVPKIKKAKLEIEITDDGSDEITSNNEEGLKELSDDIVESIAYDFLREIARRKHKQPLDVAKEIINIHLGR